MGNQPKAPAPLQPEPAFTLSGTVKGWSGQLPVDARPGPRPYPDGAELHRPLSRRLTMAAHLPFEHREALNALPVRRRAYGADQELIQRGDAFTHAFILEAGWACAYRTLASGARQV